MKRLAALALAVLTTFGFVAAANAQTAVAPLITKDATTIVRVDLSQIDGQALSQTAQKVAVAAADYFVADETQAQELKNAAPLAGMFAAQYAELYVAPLKEAGVAEFYVVVDKSVDAENPVYPYVAIPTEGLAKEEVDEIRNALKTLNSQLNGALKYRFARFGFMIVPIIPETVDEADAKAYVKERFTKIEKADDAVFAEGFAKLGTGAVVSAVGVATAADPAAKAQIDATLEQLGDANGAEGVKEFIEKSFEYNEKFVELTRYGAWKLDLNALEIVSVVETKSPEAAQEYLALVEEMKQEAFAFVDKMIDEQLAAAEETPLSQEDVDLLKDDLAAIVDAFVDAVKADGASLTWKLGEQFFVDAKPVFDKLVEDGTALQAKIAPAEEAETEDGADDEESLDDELDLEAL